MTEFGIRVLDCGEKPLPVLVKIRPILCVTPSNVKKRAASGKPFVLVEGVNYFEAEELSKCLRNLGARVEIFVSTLCPSDCSSNNE